MQTYMESCLQLLQSLINGLVTLLSNEWVNICFILVVIAAVVNIFRRLTDIN